MNQSPRLKRKNFERLIVVAILAILAVGGTVSYYFLVYRYSQPTSYALPTVVPSPTPTPTYNAYLSRQANYVGTISEIKSETEITVEREDQSKIILTLQPNVPIYQILNSEGKIPTIETIPVSALSVGQTISIYTEDKNVVALFASNGN